MYATIAIGNQKGGVGKTALTHNLGAGLAGAGYNVLLVDLDPQSSLTAACGLGDMEGRSLAEVIGGASPGSLTITNIVQGIGENLAIAPGDIALAHSELGLTSRLGRENVLKKALAPVAGTYDIILIDCPPSLGLLTVAGLVASDTVLIPAMPQALDLRGLKHFLNTLAQIQAELNPGLELLGIVPTFYDSRLTHHAAAIEAMTGANLPVLKTRIGRSVKVAESGGAGQPIADYEPKNPRSKEYDQLTQEVEAWLSRNRTSN